MTRRHLAPLAAGLGSLALLAACSDTDGTIAVSGDEFMVPTTYSFESQFEAGASGVSYQGQVCRQTLIIALDNAVRDASEISSSEYRGSSVPYFDDTIAGDIAAQNTQTVLGTTLPVPEAVDTLGELCGTKHLKEKFAGNDTVTDWKDWNTEFQGVSGQSNAEAFLRDLITAVSNQAEQGTNAPGEPHYVSTTGIDYAQYIQKFLLGAVVFAQGTDDYLDNDPATPGKGLLASAEQAGSNPYSALEHQWDEGFGYFGAARRYADRSDDVNRDGVVDDNNDGFIDVRSEHNFGASTNAAKRDVGADPSSPTDFTTAAFEAFLTGRAVITAAGVGFDDMSSDQQAALLTARDDAVSTWEQAIAATIVHYINDVLDAMAERDTNASAGLADLAKAWAEMKGFALGLQFNPASPMNVGSRFADLHALLDDQPALTNDPTYRQDLLEARALIGTTYGFSQANLEAW